MSSTDDILSAIDSAVRDYTVGPDAMRSVPDGSDSPQGNGYTSGSGSLEWTYRSVCGAPSAVEVQRYGQPWGTLALAEQYIVSDGEQQAVMPPPPGGPGVYFATMGDTDGAPQWHRLDGWIADEGLVLENAPDTPPRTDHLLQPGPITVPLYAKSSGIAASYEELVTDQACSGEERPMTEQEEDL